jgi:hypothetical protein
MAAGMERESAAGVERKAGLEGESVAGVERKAPATGIARESTAPDNARATSSNEPDSAAGTERGPSAGIKPKVSSSKIEREPASARERISAGFESPMEREPAAPRQQSPVELRIELAPNVSLVFAIVDEHVSISPAEVRAIRAAAAPLIAELAQRRPTTHAGGGES